MAEITIEAQLRQEQGSRPSRRLRAGGRVPGVIYGHGTAPISVAVDVRSLRGALTTEAGLNALIDMHVGTERHLVVARELQRHPVKGTVAHVDFQVVRRDEVIGAEIPLTLVGEAVEVGRGDGRVEQQIFQLPIRALPSDIPTGIDVDISALTIGGAVKVGDLVLPAGVTTDLDPDDSIVIGQPPRRVEAGPEGAEGEGEGEAPTGGGEGGSESSASGGTPDAG